MLVILNVKDFHFPFLRIQEAQEKLYEHWTIHHEGSTIWCLGGSIG